MSEQYLRTMVSGIDPNAVTFADSILHQGKLVPYRVLKTRGRGDLTLLVRLAAGWRFGLETHPYEEEMCILRGKGIFREEGIIRPYGPGDLIIVPPRVEHSFARVDEDTILVKHCPDLYGAQAA